MAAEPPTFDRPTLEVVAARAGRLARHGEPGAARVEQRQRRRPRRRAARRRRDGLHGQPGRPLAGHPPQRLDRLPRRRERGAACSATRTSSPSCAAPRPRPRPSGNQLVFAIAATAAEAQQFIHFVSGGHVDGVLLVSMHGDDQLARRLEQVGVPTVLNGRPFRADAGLFSVDADNVSGSRLRHRAAARAAAPRKVATITGPLDMCVGPGPADRLPAGAARRPAARTTTRVGGERRLHRRGRRARDGAAAGGRAATWTACSPPPT